MPLLNTITTPYAEAFLQVTNAAGETDEVVTQARELLDILEASPELREALASPVLEVEAKKTVLVSLFEQRVSPLFLNQIGRAHV